MTADNKHEKLQFQLGRETLRPKSSRRRASKPLAKRFQTMPDGAIVRLLFYGLAATTAVVAGLDFKQIREQAIADPLPGFTRTTPMVMRPPREKDQVRPYLPVTNPVRPRGGKVKLPGFRKSPSAKTLAARMTFRIGNGGAVAAVGRIARGTAKDFKQFLQDSEVDIKSIVFHSPGGSVRDALTMARAIRAEKLTTIVPANGYCASSCPLAFSGGIKRLATRSSWIGVHQVYTKASTIGTLQDGLADGQAISARCQQHLDDMGVDARVWVHAMRTPKDQLYIFTPKQLKQYKLATKITRATRKRRRRRR